MRRALFLTWLLLTGCGYRFAVSGGTLPGQAKSVRVPVFENRTSEPNVEALVAEALRERYARAGLLGGDDAETTLEGVVLAVSGGPTGVAYALPTYQLSIVVRVALKRGDKVLGDTVVQQAEYFSSGADVLLTEANRGAALRRLVDVLARDVVDRLAVPAPQ
jgi:hypothetical protein